MANSYANEYEVTPLLFYELRHWKLIATLAVLLTVILSAVLRICPFNPFRMQMLLLVGVLENAKKRPSIVEFW